MDLDTNVKKFRYSMPKKLICLLLSFVTMLASVSLTSKTVISYFYFQRESTSEAVGNFTDSVSFYNSLYFDLSSIQECIESSYSEYCYLSSSTLHAYAEHKSFSTSNYGAITRDEAKEYDYYIIYENGKIESKGISKEALDLFSGINKDYKIYLYFDFGEEKSYDIISGFINSIDNPDNYTAIKNYYQTAVKYRQNANICIALIIASTIASFAFGIMYLLIAGKKSRDEKAKLAFIDYVPLGLHIAVSFSLGFGATMLLYYLIEEICNIPVLIVYPLELFAAVIWLLAIELSASVMRSFRSDRRWYKFFLTYWILKGIGLLFNLTKKLFTRLKALDKRVSAGNKKIIHKLFSKPENFKRNIIFIIVGYVLFNLLIAPLFVISAYEEFFFILFLLAVPFIGANAFVLYHTIKYISQLDRIITAAREHRELEEDLDKLYGSLKMLAEGMKYTNIELQSAVAKAVKDERLRTELITNVSHDLKTPLTSIITYVDLLSKCDIQDEKAKDYIKVLDEKGAKLKRLIDDLIEASKVTSGNVSVSLSPINLTELCLQATVDAQSEFEKAGLQLIVKTSEKPNVVIADGSKTFRIIENLLSNAKKYSATSSRVYVNTYSEGGYGVFEIKNISAQPLDISADELTERFVRGDKSRNQDGNGLGLSIAKELARLQNGILEITIDGDLFKAKVKLKEK